MRVPAPPAVLALCSALRERGFEAVLVGGALRDVLLARPVRDWDVATSARVEDVLALFPRAVPVGASARHGTALVPTPDGPIDVTSYRGPDLAGDLARRDFTVNALAYEPSEQRWIDPHDGRGDLAARRLRAVGSAAARFAEDPLRALRAARLFAELGLTPDAEIEAAMAGAASALTRIAPERIRAELTRALLGAHARAAFALLRRTGIEAQLAAGVREDAAAVIGALPADATLRLAAWLRGVARGRVLARLRTGRALARRLDRLLSLHPLDASFDGSAASARKIRQRCGDAETLAALLALRGAECAVEQNVWWDARLAALRAALEATPAAAFGPGDLALDGAQVMAALGCGPGPRVGAALKHLVACVVADPSANTPERLRAHLAAWVEAPTRIDAKSV